MRRLLAIALSVLLLISMVPSVKAEGNMTAAVKSFQPFKLDGESVEIGGYLINQNNYYKLRDLAAILSGTKSQFNVTFNKEKKQIELELGKPYEKLDTDLQAMKHDKTEAKMLTNNILVDGEEVMLKAALIDQNNYVKLRDLADVVGFSVGYNKETQDILLNTGMGAEDSKEKVEEKTEDKKTEDKKSDNAQGKSFYERYGQSIKEINASEEEIEAYINDPDRNTQDFIIYIIEGKTFYKFNRADDSRLFYLSDINYEFTKDAFKNAYRQTKEFEALEGVPEFNEEHPYPEYPIYFIKKDRIKDDKIYLNSIFDAIKFTIYNDPTKKAYTDYSDNAFGVVKVVDLSADENSYKNYPEEDFEKTVFGFVPLNTSKVVNGKVSNISLAEGLTISKKDLDGLEMLMFKELFGHQVTYYVVFI